MVDQPTPLHDAPDDIRDIAIRHLRNALLAGCDLDEILRRAKETFAAQQQEGKTE